jgi:hypothetical protein
MGDLQFLVPVCSSAIKALCLTEVSEMNASASVNESIRATVLEPMYKMLEVSVCKSQHQILPGEREDRTSVDYRIIQYQGFENPGC